MKNLYRRIKAGPRHEKCLSKCDSLTRDLHSNLRRVCIQPGCRLREAAGNVPRPCSGCRRELSWNLSCCDVTLGQSFTISEVEGDRILIRSG